jgi:hypothetical protein
MGGKHHQAESGLFGEVSEGSRAGILEGRREGRTHTQGEQQGRVQRAGALGGPPAGSAHAARGFLRPGRVLCFTVSLGHGGG